MIVSWRQSLVVSVAVLGVISSIQTDGAASGPGRRSPRLTEQCWDVSCWRRLPAGALGVSKLLELLRNGAPSERQNAARALGQLKAQQAVPCLIVALRDDDPYV